MRERAWALGSDLQIGPARATTEHPGLRVAAMFVLPKPSAPTPAS
jgi:hypothetical protein